MDKNKLRAKILEQLPAKLPDAIRSRSMQAVTQVGTVGNTVLEACLDIMVELLPKEEEQNGNSLRNQKAK